MQFNYTLKIVGGLVLALLIYTKFFNKKEGYAANPDMEYLHEVYESWPINPFSLILIIAVIFGFLENILTDSGRRR